MENKQPILVVKDLKQHFKINRNFTVKADRCVYETGITMLSFNLLGDKLRDAFDPKLRR